MLLNGEKYCFESCLQSETRCNSLKKALKFHFPQISRQGFSFSIIDGYQSSIEFHSLDVMLRVEATPEGIISNIKLQEASMHIHTHELYKR